MPADKSGDVGATIWCDSPVVVAQTLHRKGPTPRSAHAVLSNTIPQEYVLKSRWKNVSEMKQ